MNRSSWKNCPEIEQYLVGERAPAGVYRDVETNRQLRLEREAELPLSLDGRAVIYVRVDKREAEMQEYWVG